MNALARWMLPVLLAGGVAAAEDGRDLPGIRNLWSRIDAAWAAGDVEALLTAISDRTAAASVVSVPNRPEGTVFLTKAAMRPLLADMLAAKIAPRFVHQAAFIRAGAPDVAYAITTRALIVPQHAGQVDRQFRLLHHDAGQWRIAMTLPCFVEPRLVVRAGAATPDGPRPGDVLVSAAGRDITWWWSLFRRQHEAAPRLKAQPDVDMVFRRGEGLVKVSLPLAKLPGPLDVHLVGTFPAQTLRGPAAENHAAAAPVKAFYAAIRSNDAAGMIASFSRGGYTFFHVPGGGKDAQLITPANAAAIMPLELKQLAADVKLASCRPSDLRVILKDNLALAGAQLTGDTVKGDRFVVHVAAMLARYKGQWGIVAVLPSQLGFRVGLP